METPKLNFEYFDDHTGESLIIEGIGSVDYRYPNKRYDGENWIEEPEVAAIETLDVLKEHRNKGYGALLLAEVVDRLKGEGAKYCRLGIINPRVINILERLTERGTIEGVVYRPTPASTRLSAEDSLAEVYEQGGGAMAEEAREIMARYEAAWQAATESGSEEEPQVGWIIAAVKL
jgi:GNAT superfamily N-acetyltransferase